MLNPLYNATARAIVVIHSGLAHLLGGGWAWALSIVLLTLGVRFVLFPLFVKQIKAQRTMQLLQPKMKEIRERYKNDKAKMNEEVMRLQKEHGNPLLGCLPMLVQIPLFLSLYHVLNGFTPKHTGLPYVPKASNGLSLNTVEAIAHAKIFGVSLAAALTSKTALLKFVGSDPTATKVLAIVLIVVMGVTTFITQRQIYGRSTAGPVDPTQATTQKVLLYMSPVLLAVFGLKMPIGVLLYWFTTNAWSMGQQYIVLKRMPPALAAATPPATTTGRQVQVRQGGPAEPAAPAPLPSQKSGGRPPRTPRAVAADGPALAPASPRRAGAARPPKKRSRNQRRGGRR